MQEKKLIKVLDQDKAQELIDLGFKYTTEAMNGKNLDEKSSSEILVVILVAKTGRYQKG